MAFDSRQLLDLIPMVAGAMKRGSPEAAAISRGFMRAQQRAQQEHIQQHQMQGQDDLRQAQIQNLEADNARAQRGEARAEDSAALQRLTQALGAFRPEVASQTETATDPVAAESALLQRSGQLESAYGLKPAALAGFVPNMQAPISARKKKRAQALYDQAEKRFGPEALAGDSITIQTEEFGPVKPAALRAMFEALAVDAQGAVVTPRVAPAGVPTTERMTLAAFARERGKTPETLTAEELLTFNKRFKQSDDRPSPEGRARYNVQAITNPDGTTGLIRVDLDNGEAIPITLPAGAGSGRPTDTQRLSAGYYTRTAASDVTAKGFETNLLSLGSQLGPRLPTLLASSEGQQYKQAKDEFINAALRRESGAAIQPSEYARFDAIYFVMPGDTKATIAQKQAARQRVIDGFRVTTGNISTTPKDPTAQTPAADTSDRYERYKQRRRP